ncbi:uncharacterized protein LOC144905248 isoform X2 [Branchiostoma floridae x Branchiostoma belcheri]
MATLATTTALMALLACLFVGLPEAGAEGAEKVDIATLRETLQRAIELEWSTIPPYLSAALSIKKGTNKQVNDTLWGILGNEMDHMAVAANMLNAIGGAPVLNDPDIAPRYPGPLPAGCLPHLTVTLEKMSKSHTEKVLMEIETPECEDSVTTFHDHLSKVASSVPSNEMSEKFEADFPGLEDKCNEVDFSPDTIGAIYIHKILCPMLKLEKEARQSQETIFTGDPARQVSIPFKVSNLTTAIKAVAFIVSQGEGGDPCNPYVDADFTRDNSKKEPCHYFKFAQIVHGRGVEVGGNQPCQAGDPECTDYFSPCDGEPCGKYIQFEGDPVDFNEDDVWPILSNPSTGRYPPGSDARRLSDDFNAVYVDLMQCLHEAVNGHPDKIGHDPPFGECIDKMHSLRSAGEELVKTPINSNDDPNAGPNAAPTYEFYHGAQDIPHQQQQQQQQRIEL